MKTVIIYEYPDPTPETPNDMEVRWRVIDDEDLSVDAYDSGSEREGYEAEEEAQLFADIEAKFPGVEVVDERNKPSEE